MSFADLQGQQPPRSQGRHRATAVSHPLHRRRADGCLQRRVALCTKHGAERGCGAGLSVHPSVMGQTDTSQDAAPNRTIRVQGATQEHRSLRQARRDMANLRRPRNERRTTIELDLLELRRTNVHYCIHRTYANVMQHCLAMHHCRQGARPRGSRYDRATVIRENESGREGEPRQRIEGRRKTYAQFNRE